MPEGDTILRSAQTLERALGGKTVTRFETVLAQLARVDDDAPIAGRTIERVYAAGKHLLIEFSGNLTLRTHMRMSGSWHIYRPGERWQAPKREARIIVATADFVAVGFSIPVAEFVRTDQLAKQPELRHLGPDLLGETFDEEEAVRRMRARGDVEIGEVLLNQRVVAGAGNIYKSESLFLSRINPFTNVAELEDEQLRTIVRNARKLLQRSVQAKTRNVWQVYERGGEPCRKCGTPIAYRKQGLDVRGTYWCPRCQG